MDVLSRNCHPPHLPCSERRDDCSPGFPVRRGTLDLGEKLTPEFELRLGYHAAPPVPPSVVYKGSIERIQLPDDRRLWSLPHKTNRSTSRFSYKKKKKIHQNPEAVRISAVCEAASNTDCRGGDLCTAGTGIIKRPLAEWVLKPRFSRPDSQAFPPGSQPLPAGWGEQVASGAIPGKSPPGPALPFVM